MYYELMRELDIFMARSPFLQIVRPLRRDAGGSTICGQSLYDSEWCAVSGSCEYCNEDSGCITGRKILEFIDYLLMRQFSVQYSCNLVSRDFIISDMFRVFTDTTAYNLCLQVCEPTFVFKTI